MSNQLVELVTANGFDGIELDYEKFAFSDGTSTWAATRPAWVAFVTELGTALHGAGKRLALAVPPMYDGTYTSSSGYWVYDYAGVAPVVDSLRIMTYDYSVSRPGPISPLSFIRRTLAYAVTAFPAAGSAWGCLPTDGSGRRVGLTGHCRSPAPARPTPAVPGTTSFTTATAMTYLTSSGRCRTDAALRRRVRRDGRHLRQGVRRRRCGRHGHLLRGRPRGVVGRVPRSGSPDAAGHGVRRGRGGGLAPRRGGPGLVGCHARVRRRGSRSSRPRRSHRRSSRRWSRPSRPP